MLKQFTGASLGSNTYVVYNEVPNKQGLFEAMIIDTGNKVDEIASFVKENTLEVKYIVLTHGHYDHVCFIDEYRTAFPQASVVCHEDESKVITDIEANVSFLFGDPKAYADADVKVKEGSVLSLCGEENGTQRNFDLTVMHTPGHTPGCICLYNEERRLMFTGDTLFAGGYGRTDFKYGSGADLMHSLNRLLAMDERIEFYAGHGEMSKIGWERY